MPVWFKFPLTGGFHGVLQGKIGELGKVLEHQAGLKGWQSTGTRDNHGQLFVTPGIQQKNGPKQLEQSREIIWSWGCHMQPFVPGNGVNGGDLGSDPSTEPPSAPIPGISRVNIAI